MVKKSALKQKPIAFSVNKNRIRKVGKRMHRNKTKVTTETVFSGLYYDPKLSATQNMVKYGLCPDPNMNSAQVKQMVESVPETEKKMLPYHHLLREEEDSIWKHIVTPQEQMFLQDLSTKYGRDYVRMAFDVKLNPFQYTPKQLQKKFEKFDKYVQFETERIQKKLERAQQRAEKRQQELEKAIAEAKDEEENEENDDMSSDDDGDEEDDMSHLAQDQIVDFDESSDDDEGDDNESDEEGAPQQEESDDDDDDEEDQEALRLEKERLEAKLKHKQQQQKQQQSSRKNNQQQQQQKKKTGPQKRK